MNTDENNQEVTIDNNNGGDGNGQVEEVKLTKAEYEELIGHKSAVGSLKRDLKEARKALDEKNSGKLETPKNQPEEFGLLQKSFLRAAGIVDPDVVELAKTLSKKWNMDIDVLVDDEDFKAKAEKITTAKSNAKATDVEGGSGTSGGAKNSTEYWSQRGELPTAKDVSDRKTRANIHREMAKRSRGGGGGKFYNE